MLTTVSVSLRFIHTLEMNVSLLKRMGLLRKDLLFCFSQNDLSGGNIIIATKIDKRKHTSANLTPSRDIDYTHFSFHTWSERPRVER